MSKLIIIAFTGLATISSLFLFSSNSLRPEPQSANVIETVITPSPSKPPAPKPKTNSPVSSASTPAPAQIQTNPTPIATAPSLTPTPAIPVFTPDTTPTPAPTYSPTTSSTPIPEQSTKININTANSQELDKITGIGPAYAKNIIDYRTANGPFQKIEDIIKVKGIGDKTFEKMKNEITI